jgi:hypothetical protein
MRKFTADDSEHAVEAYDRWLHAHPDGYVVNRIGRHSGRMHRARCGHLFPPTPGLKHLRKEKWVALDRSELEAEARSGGVEVRACPDCNT